MPRSRKKITKYRNMPKYRRMRGGLFGWDTAKNWYGKAQNYWSSRFGSPSSTSYDSTSISPSMDSYSATTPSVDPYSATTPSSTDSYGASTPSVDPYSASTPSLDSTSISPSMDSYSATAPSSVDSTSTSPSMDSYGASTPSVDPYATASSSEDSVQTNSYEPTTPQFSPSTMNSAVPTETSYGGRRSRRRKMRGGYSDYTPLTGLAYSASPISDIKTAQPNSFVGGRTKRRTRKSKRSKRSRK
jgi:hypothetical protein